MIDEKEIQSRVKLIKKARIIGIINDVLFVFVGLCMLLPTLSVSIEITDGLELNLGNISLLKTSIEYIRNIGEQDNQTLFATAIKGWSNESFLRLALPIGYLLIFVLLIFIFGFYNILFDIISICRAEGKVRKWAERVKTGKISGELKIKWYNSKVFNFIGWIALGVCFGAILYFPFVLYPWVFKVAGCTINWFYMLLSIFLLVVVWIVALFRLVLAFTHEELAKLETHKIR